MAALPQPRSGRALAPGPKRIGSPDRRRVLDAALGPQRVEAALDLERGALAHVALEHLAVVADVLDDAYRPILGQPELLAVVALGTDELFDVGIVRAERLADVLLGEALLLGDDHRVEHPFDDV